MHAIQHGSLSALPPSVIAHIGTFCSALDKQHAIRAHPIFNSIGIHDTHMIWLFPNRESSSLNLARGYASLMKYHPNVTHIDVHVGYYHKMSANDIAIFDSMMTSGRFKLQFFISKNTMVMQELFARAHALAAFSIHHNLNVLVDALETYPDIFVHEAFIMAWEGDVGLDHAVQQKYIFRLSKLHRRIGNLCFDANNACWSKLSMMPLITFPKVEVNIHYVSLMDRGMTELIHIATHVKDIRKWTENMLTFRAMNMLRMSRRLRVLCLYDMDFFCLIKNEWCSVIKGLAELVIRLDCRLEFTASCLLNTLIVPFIRLLQRVVGKNEFISFRIDSAYQKEHVLCTTLIQQRLGQTIQVYNSCVSGDTMQSFKVQSSDEALAIMKAKYPCLYEMWRS